MLAVGAFRLVYDEQRTAIRRCTMHDLAKRARGDVLVGALLGLVVLGVGGRIVMWGIALATGVASTFTLGGTSIVLAAGAGAGLAGGLLYTLSRFVAARVARGSNWFRLLLFGSLLALITLRGLRGSPPSPSVAFWPLVMLYAILLERLRRRDVVANHEMVAIASPLP